MTLENTAHNYQSDSYKYNNAKSSNNTSIFTRLNGDSDHDNKKHYMNISRNNNNKDTENNSLSSSLADRNSTFSSRLSASPAMNILCLTTISEVNPHLYLSGASAVNEYKIRAKGITLVINVTIDFPNLKIPGVESMAIRLDDSPTAQLYPYFDTIADKIRDASRNNNYMNSNSSSIINTGTGGGKTLVHCMVGASRSATLVLAYLMKHRKMSLAQAYYYLKRIRPIIRPNVGFIKQLVAYEYRLFGHNSVKMIFATPPNRGLVPDIYCDEF